MNLILGVGIQVIPIAIENPFSPLANGVVTLVALLLTGFVSLGTVVSFSGILKFPCQRLWLKLPFGCRRHLRNLIAFDCFAIDWN